MSYHHLTLDERESILVLRSHHLTIRNIALRLKRSPSTISRELRRLSGEYKACIAQGNYQTARTHLHKPSILSKAPAFRTKIANLILDHHWSPEQIVARLKSEHITNISFNTIYHDIEKYNLDLPFTSRGDTGIRRYLRRKGHRQYPKGSRKHATPNVPYIPTSERPAFINNRSRIGDWELDTVLGKVNEEVLVTLVERKTRYSLIGKAPHKNAVSINNTVLSLLRSVPKAFVHSITPDHGVEFLHLEEVAAELAITVYWPKPYSPQERGTNENTNGLIRDYFPRNQLIRMRSNEEVHQCQLDLNRRPRRILGYRSPYEVFFDKVLHLV
ncbi:IS30 family transposase [Secundilactobacillus folii]|nr:IS30 family transposase [Secundilactobacillus folii]